MGVHFLGGLPLDPQIRVGGDTGHPVALQSGGNVFAELAQTTLARIKEAGPPSGPSFSISE
jgi:hypothetical protein